MREIGLSNTIYIDPLTELPNFFKFLETDFEKEFGERGVIIIFDMANFKIINDTFGRSIGDLCLRNLSDSINIIISEYTDASIFRTHGDEFTIIVPNMLNTKAIEIAKSIKHTYTNVMISNGYTNCEVHSLIIDYNQKILSIVEFYVLLIHDSLTESVGRESKFNGTSLLSHIIGGIINRVKDTIAHYNNAYNLALVDDISGLPNHRAGQIYISDLLKKYSTRKDGFSLLFIDGDNLKRYNIISYEAGNKMIRDLSQIILGTLRNEDRIYRWLSGDEFLVVINETNEENVFKIAERIRENVEKQTIGWINPITVSIGISSYQQEGCSIDVIINNAERANSYAKNTGKNKVVLWDATI